MSISKLNEADDANLRERIEELERKVNELAGGRMSSWKSDELAPEIHEEFLRTSSNTKPLLGQLISSNFKMPASSCLRRTNWMTSS